MDALQQTPSTVLLSAQEAKERLREIVEGFFFRRLRDRKRREQRIFEVDKAMCDALIAGRAAQWEWGDQCY